MGLFEHFQGKQNWIRIWDDVDDRAMGYRSEQTKIQVDDAQF